MFDNRNQAFKTEFMMTQSCERRKDEMVYQNINRKFLNFNLENHQQMVQVGSSLKPFGVIENVQHKAYKSKIEWLRIWAETGLARKGVKYIRRLYQENPEKFFDVKFSANHSPVMELTTCKYILSDSTSLKTISLVNDDCSDEMKQIRKSLLEKEQSFNDEQKLAKEFTPESFEAQNLIAQPSM